MRHSVYFVGFVSGYTFLTVARRPCLLPCVMFAAPDSFFFSLRVLIINGLLADVPFRIISLIAPLDG